ncbi:Spo0B domain-containing protein [Desulfitobacterium sp.]|uniref:Spo0B domain-containing protein n=1 Tax=Desulfitobacterium sp. TaxID=49981 RepID=UPI002BBC4A8C|nr:Spo0B domain-containing protein [Desulfitobacterium sp.]HVJ50154.1 Spo0B domain-containing protein [Desulfitobacterium sp.]
MHDGENLEHILLREQLEYYRLQRHDFLNHGQVIMGYLQLGKAEKALEYLREAIDGLEAEQIAGQISQETVGAIILGLILSLRQQRIPVELYLGEQMKTTHYWEEFWREEYGQALYGYTKECIQILCEKYQGMGDSCPDVYLNLDGDNGFSCHIKVMQENQTVWENQLALLKTDD